MSFLCNFGIHTWNGCTCKRCNNTRDEQHDFVNNICKFCGQGTFTDARDGKTYKIAKIGNKLIMSANLAYKPSIGSYWAYKDDESNVTTYGYLYDWETAKKVIPQGWHLPSKEELETLLQNVGGKGKKAYYALTTNGDSGFSALFGGVRYYHRGGYESKRGAYIYACDNNRPSAAYGSFYDIGVSALFWGSSQFNKDTVYCLELNSKSKHAHICNRPIQNGYSVRCIKDT